MVVPTTYAAALAVAILAMLCWGLWANTVKIARRRRFELYSFDFALGFALMAVLAMATLGTFGEDVATMDNLILVRRLEIFQAAMTGLVIGLSALFTLAGITLGGMAFAVPVVASIGMTVSSLWQNSVRPSPSPLLLYAGVGLTLLGVVVASMAHSANVAAQPEPAETPGKKRPPKQPAFKAIALSIAGGFVLGWLVPLISIARRGQIPINPYAIALVAGPLVIFGTLLFSLYFFNLPVQGNPLSYLAYLKGGTPAHIQGLIGGAVWCIGLIAYCAVLESGTAVARPMRYLIGSGVILLAAGNGFLIWKEFARPASRGTALILVAALAMAAGAALLAAA